MPENAFLSRRPRSVKRRALYAGRLSPRISAEHSKLRDICCGAASITTFANLCFTPWLLYFFAKAYKLYFFTSLPWTTMKALGDSKLSAKYQVTIPKRVRELLKLDVRDLVLFVVDNGNVLLKKGEVRIKT
jgi:AbrB family looped-hinge helix DNA binding protein